MPSCVKLMCFLFKNKIDEEDDRDDDCRHRDVLCLLRDDLSDNPCEDTEHDTVTD